ncbi:MAG: hypothetical protein AABW45_03485 [Nanoarchaeota archaeon]
MPVNMQELKFKVIEFVRMRGPVIPVQISKQIGSNILFAGAVLSELLSTGKIKISHAKIGGSPVYYFPGQESRLTMLYGHLNQREKQAYDLLKKNNVLRDRILQPVERVALREIKDFAYPMQISDEIFWRWYLINEDEAFNLISQNFAEEQPKLEVQQIIEQPKIEIKPEIKPEIPKLEVQEIKIIEEKIKPLKVEVKKEIIKQKEEIKKVKKETKARDFALMLKNYFDEKKIKVIEENVVKKGKESDYIVEIPSQVGNVRFFLSAKDKKKLSEADLSLAHNKAQLKKLPLIILNNGELTKQAKEYLNNNYLILDKI